MESVLEALRRHQEGVTLRDLAKETGLTYNEVFNACVVLVGQGHATRHWENGRNVYVPVPQ